MIDSFACIYFLFQSTLPVRGATEVPPMAALNLKISIHAPREGSDHNFPIRRIFFRNFNPRSP